MPSLPVANHTHVSLPLVSDLTCFAAFKYRVEFTCLRVRTTCPACAVFQFARVLPDGVLCSAAAVLLPLPQDSREPHQQMRLIGLRPLMCLICCRPAEGSHSILCAAHHPPERLHKAGRHLLVCHARPRVVIHDME